MKEIPSCALWLLMICLLLAVTSVSSDGGVNNWAVIVSTSRYWHNYRHSANALSFYHLCKQNGIPDSRILLFLSDTVACNPRNLIPGTVYNNGSTSRRTNLYRCDTQVDFSGYAVNTHTFLSVVQGRFDATQPQSRRLMSDANSNLLVYLTGHGGEGFLKFQDTSYLYSEEIGVMFTLLFAQRMYRKALFVVETCHAESLCLAITAPNVACIASSTVSEDSYSHHQDPDIGIDVIDTFTYNTLSQLDGVACPPRSEQQPQQVRVNPQHHASILKERSSAVYNMDLFSFFFRKHVSYRGAYRGPVNNPSLMSQWTVGEFFCDNGASIEEITLPNAL
ncbi:GPI-anchored transamidase, putative [Bodo saltans]|uniref:GPI-anchored transamidase n=1 Tax=Bodo saltans TaxID=75058 RepID=B6DTF5_BODSA|nr:GPI-anchored transamidase [Bodo saltans]CUG88458.1 GPI-anchored transamidase, putative [Bodo saltans]|eukprot:CUG88458.1 GPI-anchored transamidase, putative [Bodo saltans]